MAIFGKSLGNGYPITAIIGNNKVMKYAQSSFISSTFWSERSGYVAALKTLEIMKKKRPWKELIVSSQRISFFLCLEME